jgi:hypothetical protein
MPRQSEALSAETQVMRAIDLALQKTDELSGRTRERVLRYAADQVADRLPAEVAAGNGAAGSFGSVTANMHPGQYLADGPPPSERGGAGTST